MRTPPKPHMIGFVTAVPRRWYLLGGIFFVAFASLLALLFFGGAPTTVGGFGCALAILFAVRVDHTKAGTAWYLLATGASLLGLTSILGDGAQRFVVHDALLTAGLLTIAAGIGLLVAARSSDRDWGSVIDTAAATAAATLVVWVTLLATDLNKVTVTAGVKVAALLCCLASLALFAVTVRLVLGLRAWTHASVLLSLAVGFLIASAITSAAVRLHDLSGAAWVIRSTLIAAFALLAACALDPSMRRLGGGASEHRRELTSSRLVLLAAAALTAPWLLSVQAARGARAARYRGHRRLLYSGGGTGDRPPGRARASPATGDPPRAGVAARHARSRLGRGSRPRLRGDCRSRHSPRGRAGPGARQPDPRLRAQRGRVRHQRRGDRGPASRGLGGTDASGRPDRRAGPGERAAADRRDPLGAEEPGFAGGARAREPATHEGPARGEARAGDRSCFAARTSTRSPRSRTDPTSSSAPRRRWRGSSAPESPSR